MVATVGYTARPPEVPMSRSLSSSWLPFFLVACAGQPVARPTIDHPVDWAIAVHGGAGTLDRNAPPAELQAYRDALQKALDLGRERLARGDAGLDVCEAVVRMLEDDPHFNAGKGAAFNEQGKHELDAAIMDGSTLAAGAVAGVRTVKNPISLARLVMQKTPHILLAGDGAEQFADAMQVPRVPNESFDTEYRRAVLEEVLKERQQHGSLAAPHAGPGAYGTVGCVVRDRQGHLAAATSTGGLTGKRWGRIGDSPLIGAGTYADGWAAVSGTGTGEQFMRNVIGHTVAARMRFGGQTLAAAAHDAVFGTLQPDDGGIIAVDKDGNLAAEYNTTGMYRALADSTGRREVRIFEQ